MASVLVVTSKVKAVAKKEGLRTSADFITALSRQVETVIKACAAKAKEAKRQTIQDKDLT